MSFMTGDSVWKAPGTLPGTLGMHITPSFTDQETQAGGNKPWVSEHIGGGHDRIQSCLWSSLNCLGFHPLTHPLIHPPTHSSTHSFTHLLIHSFIHPLIPSLTHPPTHSPTHPLTHPLIHLLIHSFIHSPIHSFTHPLIHSFTHSPTHSFIRSFTHQVFYEHLHHTSGILGKGTNIPSSFYECPLAAASSQHKFGGLK